jgi:hypothetical protein
VTLVTTTAAKRRRTRAKGRFVLEIGLYPLESGLRSSVVAATWSGCGTTTLATTEALKQGIWSARTTGIGPGAGLQCRKAMLGRAPASYYLPLAYSAYPVDLDRMKCPAVEVLWLHSHQ